MDRTMIAPWKAEEKELSEKVNQKLKGIMLLYPCTDDCRKILFDDMFLKPNPTAFFQVMHYLFRLLDPIEFKKRFYWPITDKRSEANFRSSTVEYLKHLNDKYELNWNIKSYLVVMPGGMKFINFLLEFISFIIQELTKKREKELFIYLESEKFSELNLHRIRKRNNFYKEYASAYLIELDVLMLQLQDKIEKLHHNFDDISKNVGISREIFYNDSFFKDFQKENEMIFKEKFSNSTEELTRLKEPLSQLNELIENFQFIEMETKLNADEVRRALQSTSEKYSLENGIDNELLTKPCRGDAIKMNVLMWAFTTIHNSMEDAFITTEEMPQSSEFVKDELNNLKKEIHLIEIQITEFKKQLNMNIKKKDADKNKSLSLKTPLRSTNNGLLCIEDNTLFMKFVSTPPIKLDNLQNNRVTSTRLPLWDDKCLETFDDFIYVNRSVRKPKVTNKSIDMNHTMNKSKIIDPMQLLRTISKKDTVKAKLCIAQPNLSSLSTKWKERQQMFTIETGCPLTPTKQITDIKEAKTPLPHNIISPYSPFNTNEKTRIAKSHLHISGNDGHLSIDNAFSNLPSKRLSAVQKVQDASINLSTSPSGRLDPLVIMETKDFSKFQINNTTLNNFCTEDDTFETNENNQNTINTQGCFEFRLNIQCEEDAVSNISDTILHDLIL